MLSFEEFKKKIKNIIDYTFVGEFVEWNDLEFFHSASDTVYLCDYHFKSQLEKETGYMRNAFDMQFRYYVEENQWVFKDIMFCPYAQEHFVETPSHFYPTTRVFSNFDQLKNYLEISSSKNKMVEFTWSLDYVERMEKEQIIQACNPKFWDLKNDLPSLESELKKELLFDFYETVYVYKPTKFYLDNEIEFDEEHLPKLVVGLEKDECTGNSKVQWGVIDHNGYHSRPVLREVIQDFCFSCKVMMENEKEVRIAKELEKDDLEK